MSDVEEPPTKMSKFEEEEYLEPEGEEALEEGLEEGQEEWLSEGVLTDDDYVHTTEQDQEKADISMENTQETIEEHDTLVTMDGMVTNVVTMATTQEQKASNLTGNIEEQLNNLESSRNGDDLNDELDTFLIRKNDGVLKEYKVNKEESNMSVDKQQEDDGNDTDDLLRMLGEDDQKIKKKTLKVVKAQKVEDQGSSDDDDFVYERSQVKTLKLAKNALIKRPATKAVPEDMSDGDDETDQSSDEGSTVQRMFEVKTPTSTATKTEPQKKIIKHVVHMTNTTNKNPKQELKQVKTYSQQKPQSKPNFTPQKPNLSQKLSSTPKPNFGAQKPILKTPKPIPQLLSKFTKSVEIKTPAPFKPLDKNSKDQGSKPGVKDESQKHDDFDDVIDEEEFLEDDEFDLDEEEFAEESEGDTSKKQRIMKPEVMDEEVPSDAESRSEDGSLYDELPSSDSEDLDDWFTLDIRAERAGDYLPLLGTKAKELLLAERRRVSSRVATLRQSLSALTDSARRQADQLRAAAMALAEIDDTLRAA